MGRAISQASPRSRGARPRVVERGAAACGAVALAAALAFAATGCGGRAASRPHELHVVTIRQVAFHPATLSVVPGDTIEWRNRDLVPHTSSARQGAWDSGNLPPDSSWRFIPTQTGSFAYFCRYHTTMAGTLSVQRPR